MTEPSGSGERPLVHDVAALERTALAWERTAVSLAAVGLLLLKVVDGGRVTETAGLLLVALAVVVVLVMVPWGYRRARARVHQDDPASAFAARDRWRPRVVLATSWAITLTVLVVAADIWWSGAV